MQLYKNAWQIDDRATIERNLRLAIDATQHSLDLDPQHPNARSHLEERKRRLKDLTDSKPSVETLNRTQVVAKPSS